MWWCNLDGYDAQIGQRGKTIVQSQSVCTVHVYTQPWAQHSQYWHEHQRCMIPQLWPYRGQNFLYWTTMDKHEFTDGSQVNWMFGCGEIGIF